MPTRPARISRAYAASCPPVRTRDSYIGKEIAGQFRVVERIGSGGMGSVYKAEQSSMNRFVAIKILHPRYLSRPDLVSRFRREARAMSHLSHPNTARVFLFGQLDDGACYIVMECLQGQNIAQLVRAEGPMDPPRAINVMVQVCGALDEAHRAGIIHRDLKPENIFLTSQGGILDYPKVLDFGLAKVTEREMQPGSLILTQEGMVFGTPEFMSPEQAQGRKLDPRSDIYSLGVILYEMLTGQLPFDAAQPMDYISHHIGTPPIPLAKRLDGKVVLPTGLEAAIMKSLAKDPADRYQTAAEFGNALKTVLGGQIGTSAMRALPDSVVHAAQQAQAANEAAATASGHSASSPSGRPQPADPSGRQVLQQQSGPVGLPTSKAPWIVLGLAALLAVGGAVALAFAYLLGH